MSRELFIVIPVHNRLDMLKDLLDLMCHDPAHVILIDNNSTPPLMEDKSFVARAIIRRFAHRNIQAMWNEGWSIASEESRGPYAIAFLNSDAMVTPETLVRMAEALDAMNAAVVSTDHCNILREGEFLRKTSPGPVPWEHVMSGYGFVVRGELQSRFDEQFVWWYGDNDFDWTARQEFGGSVILGGTRIDNRDPDGAQRTYPELHEQTRLDEATFINKWGMNTH